MTREIVNLLGHVRRQQEAIERLTTIFTETLIDSEEEVEEDSRTEPNTEDNKLKLTLKLLQHLATL